MATVRGRHDFVRISGDTRGGGRCEAVLEILERLDPGDVELDERWRLALRGIDQLLTDLGFDLAAKRDYTKRWIERTMKDPVAGGTPWPQLAERYRKERVRIEPLLDRNHDHDSDLAPGLAVYRYRSGRLRAIVAKLYRLEGAGRLLVPVADLARSTACPRLLREDLGGEGLDAVSDFLPRAPPIGIRWRG